MMTDEQIKAYHSKVEDNIRKYGYHSTFVFSKTDPSFCYSTGLFKTFGIPELFISSLPENLSHTLIKNYVDNFKGGTPISLNVKLNDFTNRFPIYLIEVLKDNLKEYVLSSLTFYGDNDHKYLQLIYPDTHGRFPGEDDYDYDQKIFGNFVAT